MIRFLTLVFLASIFVDASAQAPREILLEAQHKNWIVRVMVGPDSSQIGRVRGLEADSIVIGTSRIHESTISRIDKQVRVGGGGGGGGTSSGVNADTAELANRYIPLFGLSEPPPDSLGRPDAICEVSARR